MFRHPLDLHLSFRRHDRNIPIRVFGHWYPEDDPDGIAFRHVLDGGPETDATPLAHILRHHRAARALSDRPDVALMHDADMPRDLPGTFARVAALPGIDHAGPVLQSLGPRDPTKAQPPSPRLGLHLRQVPGEMQHAVTGKRAVHLEGVGPVNWSAPVGRSGLSCRPAHPS